jgi:2-amino-4-hydroxy-6-hydroxymethyldihydropteridine diphosphokinase
MNTVIIMLGSNSQAETNITLTTKKLAAFFDIVAQSSLIITEPFGYHYVNDFHNIALKLLSDKTAEETRLVFKQIEREMGRTPGSKKEGIIPIDIDMIFWNQTLVHNDYNRFDFVKRCVDDLIK